MKLEINREKWFWQNIEMIRIWRNNNKKKFDIKICYVCNKSLNKIEENKSKSAIL